ncbi:hypothetical protein LRP31_25665 [Mesorhizobium mediterraneum]|uniref:Uncharacterized protein n=1 Tax=Mesorhizobium mediterraneum TaxID=43617 RepID=A0AB36RFY5_9HYPH|nr:hypothetical protein [Mesorhizobium mediterraneum]PAQ03690.1 hypothetical protein CIT25_04020 [Mesorhizobium mediterraneum]WIW52411.1 hypothetical protein LRP31_25665 [Mesorhizobium mediterraneum]
MTSATGYVITRFDRDRLRSVPIKGKSFTSLEDALDEAIRINKFSKYADQLLQVDLASAHAAQVQP